ncbi:unnamed protein product [Alopecurus aequalis]
MSGLIEDDLSWEAHSFERIRIPAFNFQVVSEAINGGSEIPFSLDMVVPDDILEKIFTFLPIASMIRSTAVCKRWHDIINSSSGFVSSSCGLVCFMENDTKNIISVCNHITKDWKRLLEPPGAKFTDYNTIAIMVDRVSHNYTVTLATSKKVAEDYVQWDFSIYKYESWSSSWKTAAKEVFIGWRGGDDSVICGGVLYCLIQSTGVLGNVEPRHRLIMYDLVAGPSEASLTQSSIPVPCSLTCGRLLNLRDKLVLVGGIAKHNRPDIIKGISIWELDKKQWHEVARMPHKFFQRFGELDDVFSCSGTGDLVYIQSYGATALLVFDTKQKRWKWSAKCPVSRKFPLQLFSGFCFEPRLDITT